MIAAAALAGAGVTLVVSPAGSHTDFVESDPRDGTTLDQAPRELTLEFSDEMDPGLSTVTLQVDGDDNTSLDLRSGPNPTVLVAAVPTSLPPDVATTTWRVAFRVVSADGHPVAGTFEFAVRAPEPSRATESFDPPLPQDDASPDQGEETQRTASPREAWPLVAVAVGVLVLMALAVAAVMRLVRRNPDA